MQTYTVLYRLNDEAVLEHPFGFICEAEDTEHAEEQCDNAYPGCDIVWVVDTGNYYDALDNYYTFG